MIYKKPIIIFLVLVGLYYLVYSLKSEAKTFMGLVMAIKEDEITVQWLPVGFGIDQSGLASDQVSVVSVSSGTKIIKESGAYELRVDENSNRLPTREDVRRERTEVDFGELRRDTEKSTVYVKIFAKKEFFNRKEFKAETIYYNADNISFSNY